jgi:hypothetical protein
MNVNTRKYGRGVWAALIGAALAVGPVWAVNVVHLTNLKELQAKSVQWRSSAQEYMVVLLDNTQIPIPKAQVARLEIDKPAEFDKAAQMVVAKQFDAAIPLLEDIVTKYTMLQWDNPARELLAQAQLFGKNDPKKAVATLEEMLANMPKADVLPETYLLYWKALLAAGQTETLKKALADVIATGTREMAAAAQIMRGNMNHAAGQDEAALLDYLRTVILFEQVKSVQPEALFRAAEVLEKMRDPRAEAMRKKLVQDYRDSEWAAKLSGKM